MAAVRLVGAARRDERDALGLVRPQLDLVAAAAGNDPRVLEESGRGEVVAAARGVDEGQRDRLDRKSVV